MKLERKVVFHPAYDRRSDDPRKNYGIHGLEMQFQVLGEDGGVTFTIFTNWMLPHVQREMDAREPGQGSTRYMFHKPQPGGCDGHWKRATYEGQSSIENCSVTGGTCFCDGTGMTEDLFNLLVSEGEEALWKKLEERYEIWRPK